MSYRSAWSGVVAALVAACGDRTVSVGNGERVLEEAALAELAENVAGTWYGTFPGQTEVALTLSPRDEPFEMSVGLRCTTENCFAGDWIQWLSGIQPAEGTGVSSQFAMGTAQLTALLQSDSAGTRVECLMTPEAEMAQAPPRLPSEFWLSAQGDALIWKVPVINGPLDFVRAPH